MTDPTTTTGPAGAAHAAQDGPEGHREGEHQPGTPSEPTAAAQPATAHSERPATGPEGDEHDPAADDDGDGPPERRRDLRTRERLRETEQALEDARADVDRLRHQLTTYQADEVSRIAGEILTAGSDVLIEHDLADLVDDEGRVVLELVTKAAQETGKAHPHWTCRYHLPVPAGLPPQAQPITGHPEATSAGGWADFMSRDHRAELDEHDRTRRFHQRDDHQHD